MVLILNKRTKEGSREVSPKITPQRAGRITGFPAPKRRYPVQVDLRYKLLQNGFVAARGFGKTLEFGDGKVSFNADRPLLRGTDMELSLDWPLRIDGVCPLQLVVFGQVVASNEEGSTLQIARHEFRARGTHIRAPQDAVQRSGLRIQAGSTANHARRG